MDPAQSRRCAMARPSPPTSPPSWRESPSPRPAARGRAPARRGRRRDALIVEGVGGLLTPLAEDYSVCDLAVALGLPLLMAARPGLGTINHTLLTLRVAPPRNWTCAASCSPPGQRAHVEQLKLRDRHCVLGDVQVEGLSPITGPACAIWRERARCCRGWSGSAREVTVIETGRRSAR